MRRDGITLADTEVGSATVPTGICGARQSESSGHSGPPYDDDTVLGIDVR
jgi:hypothetical protein